MLTHRLMGAVTGLFILFSTGAPVFADNTAQLFLDGVRQYQAGDFDAAVSSFADVVSTGIKNGRLYYNLGNAHLKNGDIGRAMLWYLRAKKLIPGDPDLAFNLAYAQSQVKDEKPDEDSGVFKVLFFWNQRMSAKAVQWAAVFLNLIFWGALAVCYFRRKRALNPATVLLLAATIVFLLTAVYHYDRDRRGRAGVVLPESVSVRSGFSENATELFLLHGGSRVTVSEENGGFVKILFSKGKIGWVAKNQIGVI